MQRAAFVLAGGGSTRMGRDKALLPYGDGTLIEHVARQVREAAGSAVILGDPARYGIFGYPVQSDLVPGCGPLGGLYSALRTTTAEWNLIVACDMPGISRSLLNALFAQAAAPALAVLPVAPNGKLEPLCALYHQRCLAIVEQALKEKRFTMRDLAAQLNPTLCPWPDADAFANVNTPVEWAELEALQGK
jgi:molybdopterin-guanine dinucleotide biosynthesis protein A